MPHVLLHHLCVTRHILMTAKFGTQFQFQFHFHFETHISIVFPPVSPLTIWRMFQYARLTQAAASSYLSRARPLAERKVCSLVFARTFVSQPWRVGMRRSQTPAATKLGTKVRCAQTSKHDILTYQSCWGTCKEYALTVSMHQLAPSSNSTSCSRLGKTHTLFRRAKAFTYCTMRRSRTEPSWIRSRK
jgi:hypothetical protein